MLNLNKKFNKIQVSSEIFAIIISLYCLIIVNNNFWLSLSKISLQLSQNNLFFIVSTLLIALLSEIIIINLIIWGKSAKYLGILIIICTVLTNYFCKNYGINFDRSMVRNIFATDLKEAHELLTINLLIDCLYFALIPSIIIIFCFKIKPKKLIKTLLHKIVLSLILILIICSLIFNQFKNLSFIIKYHPEIKYQLLPTSFMISGFRIIFENRLKFNQPLNAIDPAAQRSHHKISKLPITVIVIAGETVRADNWGISGYKRQTTPELSKLPIINFPYANSCGTNTEISLPCMFSATGRKNYNKNKISSTESILHLLDKLDIDVTWIDNQSGCKGICSGLKEFRANIFDDKNKYCNKFSHCLDEVLIEGLKANILNSHKDQIIVLHQLGNHGPAYFARYPEKFKKFIPTCNSYDLINCNTEEIINAYDNAILYTDHILAKMIQEITNIKTRNFFFIYLSDHGESLGENNIYLHGIPYAIAPTQQKRVPMFFWHSENFPVNHQCLLNKALNPSDHDHLYHTLLGLFQINSNSYNQDYDLLLECYNNNS